METRRRDRRQHSCNLARQHRPQKNAAMFARTALRRLSVAPVRNASSLVIGEHAAGALAAGTYHAIGAASQLGGDVSRTATCAHNLHSPPPPWCSANRLR